MTTNHPNKENIHFNKEAKKVFDLLMQFQNEGYGTVFFEINGHVQNMHVRVFTPIWKEDTTPSFSDHVYMDDEEGGEYVNAFVDRLIKHLDSVKITQPA